MSRAPNPPPGCNVFADASFAALFAGLNMHPVKLHNQLLVGVRALAVRELVKAPVTGFVPLFASAYIPAADAPLSSIAVFVFPACCLQKLEVRAALI